MPTGPKMVTVLILNNLSRMLYMHTVNEIRDRGSKKGVTDRQAEQHRATLDAVSGTDALSKL
ncbi:hypothetical protein GCM10007418_21220 [Halopseudomonas salina]|uniref:Uncharacterized protein n=1 Tax=Halopseudomonas salina TaxID=1323744 RepID=A0ABQ1PR72_9GAMM|nr:hypothetical protein GCM10007418_21220 [Halopseudomonas salina]